MASLQKNVASQNLAFALINKATGAASTTTSTSVITAFVTKDGAQATAGGTFSYLGTGEWNYAPTQAETNATNIGFYVTTSSSDIPFHATIWTDPGVILTAGTGTNQISLSSGLVALSTTSQSSLCDFILDRDMSLGTDSGSSSVRTPRQALRVLRNKVDVSSGTTLIVYKEDDATTSWTASVVASSSANPIVTLTPP